MTKVCTKCLITKSFNDYYIRNGKPISACKDCTKKIAHTYKLRTGKYKGVWGKSRFDILLGKTINDWTVIGDSLVPAKRPKVLCRCKCGTKQLVICDRLDSGVAKGCRMCHPVSGPNSHLFEGVGEISISYLRKIVLHANERNINVSVTADELWELYIKQNKKCALTGLDLNFGKHIHGQKTKAQSQTASLDRIDSKKGYTIDNLQWVHKHVNIMKNRYDNEYFKQICKLVVENAN